MDCQCVRGYVCVRCAREGPNCVGHVDAICNDAGPAHQALSQDCGLACGSICADEPALSEPRLRCEVTRVCAYIRSHLAADIDVATLAARANLSPHYFSALFRRLVGIPPHQFVLHARIQEAQRQLLAGCTDIPELALSLGFSDQSHFSRAFRKLTGTTPRRYQRTQ